MGNCCRRESSATVWASVDEVYESEYEYSSSPNETESLIEVTSPVKTKVTKREMEKIVVIARELGVPVDRVLSRFIHAVHLHSRVHSQRSWEPVLDTIAE